MFAADSTSLDIDFGQNKHGSDWRVINDGVMGGLSQGQAVLDTDSILFRGDISLKNNGGFSSLRSPFAKTDLSRFSELEIRYRHQGHPVALTFDWHRRFYKTNHKVVLATTDNNWQTARVKLEGIKQYRLGKPTGGNMTKADLKKVIRLGFIAGQKEESDFVFEVDYIQFLE